MAIIEIGQKKVINGKVYRKREQEDGCEGCAFKRTAFPCAFNCDNPPDVTVAVENGGSECDSTIWVEVTPEEQAYEERACVDAVKPVNAVRTVTLEFIKGPVTCDNCAFGSPYVKGCPALQNGDTSLDCASEGYFRVKAGA